MARKPTPATPARAPREAQPASGAPALPSLADLLDPRQPWLAALLLVLLSRWIFTTYIPLAAEDAYITFRYARNFANGIGLVFNPGEQVMGFSSPLWTLWSSLAFKLHVEPEVWTRLTTLLGDMVSAFAMVTLLRRHASVAAAWAFGIFFGAWPFFGAISTAGMETSMFFTLISLSALLLDQRSPLTGLAIASLVFIRPEGVLPAAILLLGATWRDRGVALALIAGGIAALTLAYGSAIPQSVIAKSQVYGHPGPWAGRHWWEWLLPFPLGRWPVIGEANFLVPLSVILGPAVVLGVVALAKRSTSALTLAVAGALAVYLSYVVVGAAYFWWYFMVPLSGLAACAAIGLPQMLKGRALWISLACCLAGMWTLQPDLYRGRAQTEYTAFVRASEVLLDHVQPGQSLFLEPIGIVGFRVPARIIDETGLVTPAVSKRRLQGPGWYADIAATMRPDFLLVRAGTLQNADGFAGIGRPFRDRSERDSLMARYTRVAVIDSTGGANAMMLLQRFR